MKKGLLTSFLFIILCFSVNAQCSVRGRKEGAISMNEAKFEYLYKDVGDNNNGDYTRGFAIAYGRAYTAVKQSGTAWGLQIIVIANPRADMLVPRAVKFFFKDGTSLKLTATAYSEEEVGKLGLGQLCTFPLTVSDVAALRRPIKSIVIADTRVEEHYESTESTGLYDKVLAEQISCLL